MKEKAYAKINLSLDITGVRKDGYHLIDSIMLPVDFYDELEINKSEIMSYASNEEIIFNEKNTIVKVVSYMKDKYQIKDNFNVYLDKKIPSQAGLGGGSSDGAAAIRLLSKMYDIKMSEDEIKEACLNIGADVLFTYYNVPARVRGIGEIIDKIIVKKEYYILLIKPDQGVSTKEAYENLVLNISDHPNIDLLVKVLEDGSCLDNILKNSLEEPAFRLCPEIASIKKILIENGIKNVLMSGSGSTVFVISENEEELNKIKKSFINQKYFIKTVKTLK